MLIGSLRDVSLSVLAILSSSLFSMSISPIQEYIYNGQIIAVKEMSGSSRGKNKSKNLYF